MKVIIRIRSDLLHELLQRIAARAYEQGRQDALEGRANEEPLERVPVNPDHLRKFA